MAPSSSGDLRRATNAEPIRASTPSALVALLASAALPGTGQVLQRQGRAVAYLALEAASLAYYVSQSTDGRRQRNTYREISRTVARAGFSPDGPRGDWDYYERMGKFVGSGAFDSQPGGSVNPESDDQTYNGSVWLLARQTFWRDPNAAPPEASAEYAAALAFYEKRAVASEMRWSWAGEPEAYQRFRGAIAGSNSAFRSATTSASIILANHFLSAVDAYVSVHLRARNHADGSVSLAGAIPLGY